MAVNIPIGANAQQALDAVNQVRDALRRSGQELVAFRDIDLSHPELVDVAGQLGRVQQQIEEMQRIASGGTAAAVRKLGAQPGGYNPFGPNNAAQWTGLFPNAAQAAQVQAQAYAHVTRGTIFAPQQPPAAVVPAGPGAGAPPAAGGGAAAAPPTAQGMMGVIMGVLKSSPVAQIASLAGLGHIATMAHQGFNNAVDESTDNDKLMRHMSDGTVDFDHLRESIRKAADASGLLYPQAQKLALAWERASGYGNDDTVAGHVAFGAKLGRGFGIDADSAVQSSAMADKAGLSQREFAKLIAEGASEGKMSGNVEGVMSAILRWTESSNKAGVGQNSAQEFTALYSAMTASGNTGLRANAESIIGQMDAAIKGGGGGGRASEMMTYRAFAANGERDPFRIARLQEKGMLGHVHDDGTGPTIYDAVRKQIAAAFPGTDDAALERQDNAMGRHFGTGAEVQRQIRLNVRPQDMGRMDGFMRDAKIDPTKVDATAYGELGKIMRPDADLEGMRDKVLKRGSGYTVDADQRKALEAATGEGLRQELARVLAKGGGQQTEATAHNDAANNLTNQITSAMSKVIEPLTELTKASGALLGGVNALADAIIKLGGKALDNKAATPTETGTTSDNPMTTIGYHPDGGSLVHLAAYRIPSGAPGLAAGGGSGGGGGGGGGVSSPPAGDAKGRAQQAFNEFKKLGYSDDDATALVANFYEESKLNTGAEGDKSIAGGSGGIGQWNRERRTNFRRLYGHDVAGAPMSEQVGFTNWELHHTHQAAFNALQAAQGLRGKSDAVLEHYEVPTLANQAARRGGRTAAGLAGPLSRGEWNHLPGDGTGSGTGGQGAPHLVNASYQMAPLRVIHENQHGEEMRVEHLPVTHIGAPAPYGSPPAFTPVQRQGPAYQPGVAARVAPGRLLSA